MPLTNGCRNDDVIQQLGQLRPQSLFQCVQISDAYFEYILLQLDSNLVIWMPQLRWNKF